MQTRPRVFTLFRHSQTTTKILIILSYVSVPTTIQNIKRNIQDIYVELQSQSYMIPVCPSSLKTSRNLCRTMKQIHNKISTSFPIILFTLKFRKSRNILYVTVFVIFHIVSVLKNSIHITRYHTVFRSCEGKFISNSVL